MEQPDHNTVPTVFVSGRVIIAVDGHASGGSRSIPFPITLKVGDALACMDRQGVKELIKILLDSL